MSKPDEQIMMDFCNAAAEAFRAGLQHTRNEDPHLFKEVSGLVANGLFHPELVVKFEPLTVEFRLVGVTTQPDDKPMMILVFSYGGGEDTNVQ